MIPAAAPRIVPCAEDEILIQDVFQTAPEDVADVRLGTSRHGWRVGRARVQTVAAAPALLANLVDTV